MFYNQGLFFLVFRLCVTASGYNESILDRPPHPEKSHSHKLKLMTFNMWETGRNIKDGLQKIALHIDLINPDIVAVQELESAGHFHNLSRLLGNRWTGVYRNASYPDDALFTRHQLINDTLTHTHWAIGIHVRLRAEVTVAAWALHLNYHNYGPYAACNKLCTESFQIMAGELDLAQDANGRVQNIRHVVVNERFQDDLAGSATVPMVLMGDFNSPSHLDWTADAKQAHCGWKFDWPATQILADNGLTDSYRQLHPDPRANPGYTWSTVTKFSDAGWGYTIPEPQDRIDFILYKGARLRPLYSYTYAGAAPVRPKPHHHDNEWPSDHFAVVTQFQLSHT